MTSIKLSLVCVAVCVAACATPAGAASSASSTASDSASSAASSGSESLQQSSNSSSRTTTAMASGDYQVVEVVRVAERPGALRLRLQAVADASADGEYFLYLPQQTYVRAQLAEGQVVAARQRPYGMAFARGDTHEDFFLVIEDEWARDLPSHVVTL